jgi:tRNA(adenine34) deaminase
MLSKSNWSSKIDDIYFMKKAIKLAQKAYDIGEVPIGAVVVAPDGKIIGRGYNLVEKNNNPLAHAELFAIAKAAKKIGDWRLEGCSIYVTLQPCGMCFHAVGVSRCSRLVYGAESPLFGYPLDSVNGIQIYKKHVEEIVGGVCGEQAAKLLKCFFKKRRIEKGDRDEK